MDMEMAYRAARLSSEVYMCEPAEANCKTYTGTGMVARVRELSDLETTIVAYRGTDEISDWLVNVNTLRTYQMPGCFHRGFWTASKEICGMGFGALPLDLSPSVKLPNLVITGHSLGGSLALLHGIRLAYLNTGHKIDVYTFGQPRVIGSRETALRVRAMKNLRVWRFVNCNDAVCRVPSRLRGFYHVGEQFYFNRNGDMFRNRGFWGRIKNLASSCGRGMIGDHDMEKYCDLIWRAKNHETQN